MHNSDRCDAQGVVITGRRQLNHDIKDSDKLKDEKGGASQTTATSQRPCCSRDACHQHLHQVLKRGCKTIGSHDSQQATNISKRPQEPFCPRRLRRSLSAPLSPLQPRTLNRVATSPNVTSKATSQPPPQSTGCLAVVECARTAFSFLRSTIGSVQPTQTDFQLENGMSAFIGKLLTLGFQDQALKELRILKRRLDSGVSKTTKPTSSEGQTAAQVIAELLDYGDKVPVNLLPVVTGCQFQVLRWISHSKKPHHIEAALPFLEESYLSSPVTLYERLGAKDKKETQKAARQLASLSQTILSFAPSVSSKEDQVATEIRLSPSPTSAFKLQVLCFKAQLKWWKMAGHRGSIDDDILSPFSRCVRAYTRRHPSANGPTYDLIATSFQQLMDLMGSQKSQAKTSSESP
ncbi:hypothetical protein NXS19_009170 [Fusarium pseudograminearum]|nr:hypothetical protein NXS19_009170 [Fusarium pseudograminearum]